MPKLSIITINRNNAKGLRRTIQSVITQTFSDFEYIIIDGGSIDGSLDIIKEFADIITYWISEPDKGIYNAMNKGIDKSTGNFLLFLNSGDYLAGKNILSGIFENRNYSEYILFGDISCNSDKTYSKTPEKITLNTFFYSTIPHQSAFIKSDLFKKFGYYNEELKISSDLEFWIKTIILSGVTYKKIDMLVTIRELNGISDEGFKKNEIPYENQIIFKKLLPDAILADYLNFFKSNLNQERYLFEWLTNRKYLIKLIKLFYRLRKVY